MIIRNISITNFQSYYETQTLEFSKGLNLILGKGGKGKSKLFNAFYWVFFGKLYISDIGWPVFGFFRTSLVEDLLPISLGNTKRMSFSPSASMARWSTLVSSFSIHTCASSFTISSSAIWRQSRSGR